MKRFGLKRILIPAVVLVVFAGIVFTLISLKINQVRCKTQFGECASEYVNRLSYLINQRMWPKPDSKIIVQSLSSFPEIQLITTRSIFPSSLEVNIVLRSAVGIIGELAIDDEGKAFAIATNSVLPRLDSGNKYGVGESVTHEELIALKIMESLSPLSLGPFSSKLQSAVLTITTSSNLEIIFDVNYVPNSWPDSLQLIFNRSKMDSKVPQKIDLRFKDPVVTFK